MSESILLWSLSNAFVLKLQNDGIVYYGMLREFVMYLTKRVHGLIETKPYSFWASY